MKKLGNIVKRIAPGLFFLFLILLWESVVRLFSLPTYLLPAPSLILQTLIQRFPVLLTHLQVTLYEAVVGLSAAVVVAMILAAAMNRFILVKRLFYPLFVVSQTIPIIALAPLMMIWFGFGTFPKILIVILVCFFPIVISMTEGLEAVDEDLIDLMKVMGATDSRIFFSVKLPSALPSIFAGMRISATYSVMGAVIGEWLGANLGLGVFMIRAMNSYNTPSLFAAIVLVVLLSIGMFKMVDGAAWLLMPWNRSRSLLEKN